MSLDALFRAHLEKNLPKTQSFHPFFNDALQRMLLAGGKYFRAQLLLSVADENLQEIALDAALALEFIHCYSLIHDDLPAMDNAPLRRGVATIHTIYDEASAILVGDALNTEAFLILAKLNAPAKIRLKLIEILAFNAGINGMILGQAIDCHFEGKKLNLNELEFLHIHKTAKLIAASLKMGAVLSSFGEEFEEKIYELGLKIGLIFQINDDLIDSLEDEKKAGKPTHHDTQKNSFVNLLGLEGAQNSKEKLKKECEEILNEFKPELQNKIKNLIKKYL